MPAVAVRGVNIYYESHGTGFPLVLCYGLGGNHTAWTDQVSAFSQHYRFITWDPRGHGGSDSPTDRSQYGWHASTEDLAALLDHLEIDKAFVGGLSMGGGISARFCVAHPDRVAALLVLDCASALGAPPSADEMMGMRNIIQMTKDRGMDAVADHCIRNDPNYKTQAEAGPEALERLYETFRALVPVGYANTIRSMLEPEPGYSVERLSEIVAPTLVLVGDQDPSEEAAHLTHTKIAGSEFVVIPDAGHLSNLDRPEEFNRHVLEFLGRVSQDAK